MVPDKRHSQRFLVHVERHRTIALAPYAMVAGVPTLVGREDDECVLAQPQFIQPLEHSADIRIRAADQSRVCVLWLALSVRISARPGGRPSMGRHIWKAGELRIVVPVPIFFGLVIEGRVRRIERHQQIKGVVLHLVEEIEGKIADDIGFRSLQFFWSCRCAQRSDPGRARRHRARWPSS